MHGVPRHPWNTWGALDTPGVRGVSRCPRPSQLISTSWAAWMLSGFSATLQPLGCLASLAAIALKDMHFFIRNSLSISLSLCKRVLMSGMRRAAAAHEEKNTPRRS